jgi:hypothetical protein
MRSLLGFLSQAGQTRLFDLVDLITDDMSRLSSSSVFGGIGLPSGVRTFAIRSGALRDAGLKSRMPRRAMQLFIRLIIRVRSPTRYSCSRFGRLSSSS